MITDAPARQTTSRSARAGSAAGIERGGDGIEQGGVEQAVVVAGDRQADIHLASHRNRIGAEVVVVHIVGSAPGIERVPDTLEIYGVGRKDTSQRVRNAAAAGADAPLE